MTDQALVCLDMMDFDGKDSIMQKIIQNGTMMQKLVQYMQLALTMAQMVQPQLAQTIAQDITVTMGGAPASAVGVSGGMFQSDNIRGGNSKEPTHVSNARERTSNASQPDGSKVTMGDKQR